MDESLLTKLDAPRFEDGKALLLAGLSERYDSNTCSGIPGQWQRFGPYLSEMSGHIPCRVGRTAYGVLHNGDGEGNVEYLSGVEVADFTALPAEWARLRLAPQRYAVFTHREHISTIRRTWFTIWNKWLPESGVKHGCEALDAPDFERYGEEFDARTGMGGVEIWVPLKAIAPLSVG